LETHPKGREGDRWCRGQRDQQEVEFADLSQLAGAGSATGDVAVDAATLVGGEHSIRVRNQPIAGRCVTQHVGFGL